MADINKVLVQLKNKIAELILENAILRSEVEELSGKSINSNEIVVEEANKYTGDSSIK